MMFHFIFTRCFFIAENETQNMVLGIVIGGSIAFIGLVVLLIR
jgi:hypothetical protein